MFGSLTIYDSMAQILGRMFRVPVSSKPITILELTGPAHRNRQRGGFGAVLRMTFDFALWSEGPGSGDPRLRGSTPLRADQSEFRFPSRASGRLPRSTGGPQIRQPRSVSSRSGRPKSIPPSCRRGNTVFALRMSDDRDREIVKSAIADTGAGLLEFLSRSGSARPLPSATALTLPVRIRVRRIAGARHAAQFQRPRHGDVAKSVGDEGFLDSDRRSLAQTPRRRLPTGYRAHPCLPKASTCRRTFPRPPAPAVCEDRRPRPRSRESHGERRDFAALRREPARHAREIAPAEGRWRRTAPFAPRDVTGSSCAASTHLLALCCRTANGAARSGAVKSVGARPWAASSRAFVWRRRHACSRVAGHVPQTIHSRPGRPGSLPVGRHAAAHRRGARHRQADHRLQQRPSLPGGGGAALAGVKPRAIVLETGCPQHRAGHRRRGLAGRGRGCRRHSPGNAVRPRHQRSGAVSRRRTRCGRGRSQGQAGAVRDQTQRAAHRLWLYPARGAAAAGFEHVFAVDAFTEKPNAETAVQYLAAGNYAWNSGIFVLGVRAFLAELSRLAPSLLEAVRAAVDAATTDLGFLRLDLRPSPRCPTSRSTMR